MHTQQSIQRLGVAAACAFLAPSAAAQVVFSIDAFGPTISTPSSFPGVPITEGDVLLPAPGFAALGPLPTPGIIITGGPGGLGLGAHPGCVGHAPGVACGVEVDALSYGMDELIDPMLGIGPGQIWYSTDELPFGSVVPAPPNIMTETPCGDLATDAMANLAPYPAGPHPPFAVPPDHSGMLDGDGMPSCSGFAYPGTGLIEGGIAGTPLRDNLDALNVLMPGVPSDLFPATGVYFSLDGIITDFCTGRPSGSSAFIHGFSSADVLVTPFPGALPALYAPALVLGLDLGPVPDDLDALILAENGLPGYQSSAVPNDWAVPGLGPLRDMLLFSVKRGSPVVGMPDSIFGLPIEPGDILTTPLPTALGGVSPFPGIYIAAENLGLTTMRSGIAGNCADELDALDSVRPQFTDCNGNGVDDSIDLTSGTSTDVNGNGVPDECELISSTFCKCLPTLAPCGNPYAPAGCRNSTGVGGVLTAAGTGSVGLDNLVLTASQLPLFNFGIYFMGGSTFGPVPFGDGLRCVAGPIVRFLPPQNSGGSGVTTLGPGIATAGGIVAVSTWHFQYWYRDPLGPCGTSFNVTNAVSVTFTP